MFDLRKLLRLTSPFGVAGIAFVAMTVSGTATILAMASAPVGGF